MHDSCVTIVRAISPNSAAARAETRIRAELARHGAGPRQCELALRLGFALAAQGRRQEAIAAFEQAALSLDVPTAVRALLLVAALCCGTDEALDALARAEQRLTPGEHPAAVVDVAAGLKASRQLQRARELLERVLAEAPPPRPRGSEPPLDRQARAVAALRLSELLDPETDFERIDELLWRALESNDPGVTPVAALRLAEHRELQSDPRSRRPGIDHLLRTAWSFDHPVASARAGRQLVERYVKRSQLRRARQLLDKLVERGDDETIAWAQARSAELDKLDADGAPAGFAAERESRTGGRRRRELLVVGAGSGARRLVPELESKGIAVVGLLDDHVADAIGEAQVIGHVDDLHRVLEHKAVDEVLLSIPTASPQLRYRVADACATYRVRLQTLPNIFELLPDRSYYSQLRPLRVEETFGGADPLVADPSAGDVVRSKSVLIAGVSEGIGAELARQVVRAFPRHVALLDGSETALLQLTEELRLAFGSHWTFPVVADLSDRAEVRAAIGTHAPDVVLLLGGMSHAHIAEESLGHAARMSVQGPWVVAEEAVRAGAERVVLVSSDNAGHRRSLYDCTEALAEQALVHMSSHGTVVSAVRLGNVFRTPGSVVEQLERQLSYGGPVTVTEPDAARRFLSRHVAAERVLQVAGFARSGRVYGIDGGVRVEILELARRLIRLHGHEPDRDIRIRFTGARAVEKREDALWGADERPLRTTLRDVVEIIGPARSAADVNRALTLVCASLERSDDRSAHVAHALHVAVREEPSALWEQLSAAADDDAAAESAADYHLGGA